MRSVFAVLFALIALYLLVFHQIDSMVINLWDESRLAINAVEMYLNGNWLVTHFDGKPDLWNTKPPLAIWLQTISLKLFGINELAIRLPSAIAVCLTIVLMWYLPKAHMKQPLVGVLAGLILLNCGGYFSIHVSRTADYEAVLILLFVASAYSWFVYSETQKWWYLYLGCVLLTLAALTKSTQALLLVPGVVLYFFLRKNVLFTLRQISLYAGILTFILGVGGYYWLREKAAPGYLETVWVTDMAGRFGTSLEGHQHPWFWYLGWLMGNHFFPWVLLLFAYPFLRKNIQDQRLRNFGDYSLIIGCVYQCIIAFSQTKLGWYDAPCFPFFASVSAIVIYTFGSRFSGRQLLVFQVLITILFIALSANKVVKVSSDKHNKQPNDEFGLSKLAQASLRKQFDFKSDSLLFCYEGYSPQIVFYRHAFHERKKEITITSRDHLLPGSTIYVSQERIKQDIEKVWNQQATPMPFGVMLYDLSSKKEQKSEQ